MRGLRIHDVGGDLCAEQLPEPRPAADEVLIQVEACGIGRTLLNAIDGRLARPPDLPVVPGHEIVGRVSQQGNGVTRPAIGTRVVTYFHLFCGRCIPCTDGAQQFCLDHGGQVGMQRDGGYAPWVSLPARMCVPIDEAIGAADATAIPDAIATAIHVCSTVASVGPGDRVVVIGAAGSVGVHVVQVAALQGAEVVGIDANEDKLTALADLTGCHVLVPQQRDEVTDATVVIDLVGTADVVTWAISVLAPRGRLVLLTMAGRDPVAIDLRSAVGRQLSIRGSRYASLAEVALAARLVSSGQVTPVVSAVGTLDTAPQIHEQVRRGEVFGRGAVVIEGSSLKQD